MNIIHLYINYHAQQTPTSKKMTDKIYLPTDHPCAESWNSGRLSEVLRLMSAGTPENTTAIAHPMKPKPLQITNYIIGIKGKSGHIQKSVFYKTEKGALGSAKKIANEAFYGEEVEITIRQAQ